MLLAAEGLRATSKGARIKFSGGKTTVMDGPFTGSKELIAGFWLIQVKSKEEAIAWMKRAPFADGAVLEIRQVFETADFAPSDAHLLGRVTYQGFAAAWPSRTDEQGFADRMNSLPKFVVSTTLEKVEWNNSCLIKKNVTEEVSKLKQQSGQDILVAGSATLVNTLMEHDLGFNKPSKVNEAAFLAAVDGIAAISSNLLSSLETNASPRSRTEEAAKARASAAQRFSG